LERKQQPYLSASTRKKKTSSREMVRTMGVNSIKSTTIDPMGLQDASKRQPQGESADSEFRNFVTERGFARREGPAAQHRSATAIESDLHVATQRENFLAIARGPHTSEPTLLSGHPKVPRRTDHVEGSPHIPASRHQDLQAPPTKERRPHLDLRASNASPGKTLAATTTTTALSPSALLRRAEAANAAFQKAKGSSNAAELHQQSEVAWSAFRLSIADRLLQAGKRHLFPDEVSQFAIVRIKLKYGHANAKVNEQIDAVAAQVDAFWQHLGLTGEQFDRIVQAARVASQSVVRSSRKGHGEATARENWDRVGAAIESKLRQSAADKIYPEDAVNRDIGELKARLAHSDVNFNTAASAARSRAEAQWRREGRTHDTFGVVMGLAHRMRVAERTHDQAGIAQAQGALRVEIEKQLTSATGSVRAPSGDLAGLVRAATLAQWGPHDPLFHEVLEQAYGDVFVKPRAEAVERAYGTEHDVVAAARELAAQTHNALAPLAKAVLERSLPTVASIAEDINTKQKVPPEKLEEVFHYLSSAAEDVERAQGGERVVSDVAAAIAKDFPAPFAENAPGPIWLTVPYIHAIAASVGNGDGAALPLAIASHVQGQRQRLWVANAITNGASALQGKLRQAVADHLLTPLNKFYADHGHLPAQHLEQAAQTYAQKHPEAQAAYETTLRALDALGVGAVRTVLEVERAIPQFHDYVGLERALHFLQQDKYTQYVIARSQQAAHEVTYLAMQKQEESSSGLLKPEGAVKRGLRELVKSLVATSSSGSLFDLEWFNIAGKFVTSPDEHFPDVFSGARTSIDAKKALPANIPFNILGNLVYGAQFVDAVRAFQNDPNMLDAAKGIYAALGFSKELTETLAIGVQKSWWSIMPAETAASVLAKSQRGGVLNFRSLRTDPRFVQLGYGLKVAGAALDLANAFKSFEKEQYIGGGLYGISAIGGGLGASSSLAIRGTLLADWGATIGGGISLAASIGLYVYQDYEAARSHEDPAKEFLEYAGIDAKVAATLANFDSEGRSAGPVFAAMLEAGGIRRKAFKNFLNSLTNPDDLDRLDTLVKRARRVWPSDGNAFARTSDNDESVQANPFWITRLNLLHPWRLDGRFDPHSLNGVLILGHELFHDRFPGPYRLPPP
jgi:hypothetical protein